MYNSYSLFGGFNFVSLENIIFIFFMCISHHIPLAYPFGAQVRYFSICAFFQYPFLNSKKKKKRKKKKTTQFLWNMWFFLLIVELIGIWLLFGLSLNIVNTVTTWLQFIPLLHWSSLYMHSCLTLILHWELVTWIFGNLNCIHKCSVACIYVVVTSCQTQTSIHFRA